MATVITIAHRIDSIMSCDRVMVMSAGALEHHMNESDAIDASIAGSIVEFDTPTNLLRRHDSIFHLLATEAGISVTDREYPANDVEL